MNTIQSIEDEAQRLAALYEYNILDTAPEESFDRITRVVTKLTGTRSSQVSLVDRDRQWFKSRQQCALQETPRDISFCTRTVAQNTPLIVPDATVDPRFRDSPLVTSKDPVRFYVGVPLCTPAGFNIGALCATDPKPGNIDEGQLHGMQDLAGVVMNLLELRRLATVDSLTGAVTCRSFTQEMDRAFSSYRRFGQEMACVMLDLDHFKQVNDTYGHAVGDDVLRAIGGIVAEHVRDVDVFGRVGGEEFALIVSDTPLAVSRLAKRLRRQIEAVKIDTGGGQISVTASFGVSFAHSGDKRANLVLERADRALYEAKRAGRNKVVCADAKPSMKLAV